MIIAPARAAFALALILAALYGLNWLLQRFWLWLVLMGLFVWTAGCMATAKAESVPACEAIAQAGQITVYYCQPDYGPGVYVNSVGFMLLDE